jgi:stage V sporulation protein SpoVS
MNSKLKNHVFGVVGLLIGILSISVALFQENLRETTAPPPPPPEKKSIKELAINAGTNFLREKFDEPAKPSPPPHKVPGAFSGIIKKYDSVEFAYAGLGLIAVALGVVSWVRKEQARLASGAIALGVVAIAWHYVVIGIAIAVILFIISNIDF